MKKILFKDDMLRAALKGVKTQTRRPNGLSEVNEVPEETTFKGYRQNAIVIKKGREKFLPGECPVFHLASGDEMICPPNYFVHQELYVAEPFRLEGHMDEYSPAKCLSKGVGRNDVTYWHVLDDGYNYPRHTGRWRSKLFLPLELARMFIVIEDFWVERLYDISEDDAEAEGVERGRLLGFGALGEKTFREGFFNKWIEIHGMENFDLNPWVFAYKFKMYYQTIDNEAIYCT